MPEIPASSRVFLSHFRKRFSFVLTYANEKVVFMQIGLSFHYEEIFHSLKQQLLTEYF